MKLVNNSSFRTAQLRKMCLWCLRCEGVDQKQYRIIIEQHPLHIVGYSVEVALSFFWADTVSVDKGYEKNVVGFAYIDRPSFCLLVPELPVVDGEEVARVAIHEIVHTRGVTERDSLDIEKLVIPELPVDLQKFYLQA